MVASLSSEIYKKKFKKKLSNHGFIVSIKVYIYSNNRLYLLRIEIVHARKWRTNNSAICWQRG